MSLSCPPSGTPAWEFVEPPWEAPLDAEREIANIPATAQIRGMFVIPLLQEVKRLGASLTTRERFIPFQLYALREHARLMVEACPLIFPKLSLRQGLRRLGRGAPNAFTGSTLGRVVLQSAQGVPEVVSALAKGYELNLKPACVYVEQRQERVLDVTLEQIHYFLDSHHIGTFEGALRFAGAQGTVRMHRVDTSSAVFRIEWSAHSTDRQRSVRPPPR